MNEQPLVSVFIPYYNDEKYLRQSIESVLNQTYKNFELILLNHATTDSCRNIAHSYNDERIKHIDMPKNYGAGGGILFETMLNASNGKYIKPFCADDAMRSDGLKELVNFMENNPNIDFAFGNLEYINDQNEDMNKNWFNQRPGFSVNNTETDLIRLYTVNNISMLPYIGSIVKTEALKNINYNYTFIMLFDMSIWLSLLCKGYKIGYLDKIISNYRIHTTQVSATGKEKWALQVSVYERSVFWEILFTIKDVEFIKKIFPDNAFHNKLKEIRDIPFYVATSLFSIYKPMTYIVLNKLFNDKEYLEHIENEFGWGIKELRAEIGIIYQKSKYEKTGTELKKHELFFLFIKKLKDQLKYLFSKKNKNEFSL